MKFINDVYPKISRIRAGLVFLLYGIILLSSGSNIFAIDYFEITNPKFIPVKVGLAKENNSKEVLLLNVFKENLEKILYFQLIVVTKETLNMLIIIIIAHANQANNFNIR